MNGVQGLFCLVRASLLVEGTRLSGSRRPVMRLSDDAVIDLTHTLAQTLKQNISATPIVIGGGGSDQRVSVVLESVTASFGLRQLLLGSWLIGGRTLNSEVGSVQLCCLYCGLMI